MEVSMSVVDTLGPALEIRAVRAYGAAEVAMQLGAHRLESYAKENAPWSDRTGAARAGLHAEVDSHLGEIDIILSHGVDYGYWLELIQDGEFAILLPSIEALGPDILRDAGIAAIGGGLG